MRRVAVLCSPERVVIEIEGDLDVVGGHDLRKALLATLQGAPRDVILDLSQVTSADEYGVDTLAWCSDQSLGAGRALSWSSCSRPLGRDLQRILAVRQTRSPAG